MAHNDSQCREFHEPFMVGPQSIRSAQQQNWPRCPRFWKKVNGKKHINFGNTGSKAFHG